MRMAMAALASAILAGAAMAGETKVASPPADASARGTGSGSGKVSLQDFHFTTRASAVAACDTAPITEANGRFACSLTPEQARMANNKHPDLMK